MEALSIMYHDVVPEGQDDASGFPGPGAAVYKLQRGEFEKHIAAIHAAGCVVESLDRLEDWGQRRPLFLTFDDGGVSAISPIADVLEGVGWRGHFFITTGCIGRPAFLSTAQIRDLRKRGHVIGSHSCSHPTRMARCSWEQLVAEWSKSVEVLSGILSEPVKIASVPGGYYSRQVAEAAASVGIQVLFTSEPTAGVHTVDGCRVLGRYFVQRGMPAEIAAGFASGKWAPRLKQAALWKLKKAVKAMGGAAYVRMREKLLAR